MGLKEAQEYANKLKKAEKVKEMREQASVSIDVIRNAHASTLWLCSPKYVDVALVSYKYSTYY